MSLKFAFIVVCFAIAMVSYFFCVKRRDWAWLTLGLLFTVGADYFLVIHDNHLPGVAVFCLAHVCYIFRALENTARGKAIALAAVPVLVVVVLFAFVNGLLLVLAGTYAALFLTNIAVNIKFCKINRPIVLTGLILFALCDINVALFNLPSQLGTGFVFPWAFQLIWVFYLPSQLLLAVSAFNFSQGRNFIK